MLPSLQRVLLVFVLPAGHGRAHAAEQRKERESLEEIIHSIQLESELTSRALKQSVAVRMKQDKITAAGLQSINMCVLSKKPERIIQTVFNTLLH